MNYEEAKMIHQQNRLVNSIGLDDDKRLIQATHKAIEALDKAIDYRWHPYPEETPKDKERVLAAIRYNPISKRIFYNVLHYSEDLYTVDEYDFDDKEGVPGFWESDSEWGYYEVSDIVAWKRIEPFGEE